MSVEWLMRVRESVDRFSEAASKQSDELIALTRATGEQNQKVITLTDRLKTLTAVLTVLTVFQVVFGGIQAVAILVHFYRWYRGSL